MASYHVRRRRQRTRRQCSQRIVWIADGYFEGSQRSQQSRSGTFTAISSVLSGDVRFHHWGSSSELWLFTAAHSVSYPSPAAAAVCRFSISASAGIDSSSMCTLSVSGSGCSRLWCDIVVVDVISSCREVFDHIPRRQRLPPDYESCSWFPVAAVEFRCNWKRKSYEKRSGLRLDLERRSQWRANASGARHQATGSVAIPNHCVAR